MSSILTSIKKLLNIPESDTNFDTDIIIHINTVFMILSQIGVGPLDGFAIEDDTAVWTDYITGPANIEAVKTYIYLKVRLIFDPPQSGSVETAINNTLGELEWRLNFMAERDGQTRKEEAPTSGLIILDDGTIKLPRGDTARLNVTITNELLGGNYTLNANDTLRLTVKRTVNDRIACFAKTVKGTSEFHILPTDTKNMAFGSYVYDVELTTATGDVYTVVGPATFEILEEVT